MADTDVWALSSIGSPAGTDRIPISTGSGAGGYSLRGDFLWKNGSGDFQWNGRFGIGTAPSVSHHVKSNGEIARFETITSRTNGLCHTEFHDPSGRKGLFGFAGVGNDNFSLISEMSGKMTFGTNGYSVELATNGYFHPASDNGQAVGAAANRWNVVYAASGSINTSDEREKTWRGAPTEAELRAAKRIVAELGFYQWNDAIAENGADGARYHFGVRAQQVWAIMADEELIDPLDDEVTPDCKYAFLCWDEWDAIEPVEAVEEERDEDDNIIVHAQPAQPGREAGNRFGVRSDQLTMFLIAAQEERLAALEAAL